MAEEAYSDTTLVLDSGLGSSRARMMMIRYREASVSGRSPFPRKTDSNQQSLCKQPRIAVMVVPVNQRSHTTPSTHVL